MSIYNDLDVMKFLRENMDLYDDETRHHIIQLQEDNKEDQLASALTNELYQKIQQDVTKINYESISRSRGDITRIDNYQILMETLGIMQDLVTQYRQDSTPVEIVISAEENLRNRKDLFTKAYAINASLPVITYNNIALAIVASVSFLIATCVEYIKDPALGSFSIAIDNVAYAKNREHLLFKSLGGFNDACASGELDRSLNTIMHKRITNESAYEADVKYDSPFLSPEDIESDRKTVILDDENEGGIHEDFIFSISRAVIFAVKLLVNVIRGIVYYFFHSKQKVSDFFAVQAELLEMNAYKLQYNSSMDEKQRKKIYDKQMKVAAKFHKWSNKFNIDYTTTKRSVENQLNQDEKKYKVSDLPDYNPNYEQKDPYGNSILF